MSQFLRPSWLANPVIIIAGSFPSSPVGGFDQAARVPDLAQPVSKAPSNGLISSVL
jgi:hypothetical protein